MNRAFLVACLIVVGVAGASGAPVHDDADWTACIARPVRACVFERALVVARSMESAGEHGRTLAQIARAEIDAGLRGEALAVAQELVAFAPKIGDVRERDEHLEAVVEVRAQAGEFAAAQQVLASIEQAYARSEGVQAIAVALGKAGKLADGLALLRAQTAATSKLYAYRKVGWDLRDLAVARGEDGLLVGLLREAQALQDAQNDQFRIFTGIHHPSEFVQPLLIVAAAQARAGKIAQALALARGMTKATSRAEVLAGIGTVLASAGRTDEAIQIAGAIGDAKEQEELIGTMHAPHGWDAADILLTAEAPAIKRPAAAAFGASLVDASNLRTLHARDAAYAMIASANAASGSLAEAVRAASYVQGDWPLHRALLDIGVAQAKAGLPADSVATFARARVLALRMKEPEQQLSELAIWQAEAGQIEEALSVVGDMKGNDAMSRTQIDGKWVNDDTQRRFAWLAIARALAKAGRIAEAHRIARLTVIAGGGGVGNGIASGVQIVAQGLAEVGRIDDALEAAKAETNVGWRDDLLLALVRMRVRDGHVEDGPKLITGIKRATERAQAWVAVAGGRVKADRTGAVAAVHEALVLSGAIDYPNGVIDVLTAAGGVLPD